VYPETDLANHNLGVGIGFASIEQISYDPLHNHLKVNGREWFEGLKSVKLLSVEAYKKDQETQEQQRIAERNARLKEQEKRSQENKLKKAQQTQTCPACGGDGKEYITERKSSTTVTFTEDDANYYKKTTTTEDDHLRVVKCSRCGGSGTIKQ
ncbi:MAG: hypothetical protein R3359_11670, partial [Marinirhabdus sp.]|nr:hypothetical protein [Marinirhabdus sp.]